MPDARKLFSDMTTGGHTNMSTVGYTGEKEREREREIQLFKSGFVCVNAGGRVHLVLLDSSYTPLRHFTLTMASSYFSPI